MIDLLKHICLWTIISGFTVTFSFALAAVFISLLRSSEDSRSAGE